MHDVDSIFTGDPDNDSDAFLGKVDRAIKKNNLYGVELSNEMEQKAFSDTEFSYAECYLRVRHELIGDVYSKVFNVKKNVKEKKPAKPELKKQAVIPLQLDNIQKAKFIAVAYGESQGEIALKEIPWIYVNLINRDGFERGLNNSSFYSKESNDKNRTFRILMYILGYGDQYADDLVGNKKIPLKDFAKGPFIKNTVRPRLNNLQSYIEKNIFIKNPQSFFKGWYGQGYWEDMNIRVTDKQHYRRIWALASQYFYLQRDNKVKDIYIKELEAYNYNRDNITTFLYDSDSILAYFEINPDKIPQDYYKIPNMLYYANK